jgi:lipopolysaccharide/colanic/teichoic acid biosynthesis glycosyltransferase
MWVGKRAFDLFFSSLGLFFLGPVFIFVALWIKASSKGPVFFRQERVGLLEKPFFIHKFRTMYTDAEKRGLQITVGRDPRITDAGHLLRKFKIDELPQLIDVFLGDMSLVGPRPEVPKYVAQYPTQLRKKIFTVKPGITDWASIKFKDESAILSSSSNPEKAYVEVVLPQKLSYVEEYLQTSSIFVDLKIIFMTLFEIFNKRTDA